MIEGQRVVPLTQGPNGSPERNRAKEPVQNRVDHEAAELRARLERIQADFVDDPPTAVAEADDLVQAVVRRLIAGCEAQRSVLERRWSSDEDVSTEELRLALQGYRDFFNRLLAVEPPKAR